MKKTFLLLTIVAMFVCGTIFGQYLQNFQAVYPFNKGLNPTKNYTFTKDIKPVGYMLMASSNVSASNIALAAIKFDNNFNVVLSRSFLPVAISNFESVVTNDVVATSDGGYVACGRVFYSRQSIAFIALFDGKATPVWYKEYPEITTLNSIIETSPDDIKVKYIACGAFSGDNYQTGVILGTDGGGIPIWKNNTASNGKSDRMEYNDVIRFENPLGPAKFAFAATGNAVTSPLAEKDVLLTVFDLAGNNQFSYLYGLKGNADIAFDEEAYGITWTVKNELVITGHTRCASITQPVTKWDNVLLFAVAPNGVLDWVYRYDLPKNDGTYEHGRKITTFKDLIFVTGFYKSYVFANAPSNDGYLFATRLDGVPLELRVFGAGGEDLMYALEINQAIDGIVTAGFTSSFLISPSTVPAYAPYIVETYQNERQRCNDMPFKLPYEPSKMEVDKIDYYITDAKFIDRKLEEIKNPVEERVICKKVPWPPIDTIVISAEKAKPISKETTSVRLVLSPNPVQNTITFEGLSPNAVYKIHSLNGSIVKSGILEENSMNVSNLKPGFYFITINGVTTKFIKE